MPGENVLECDVLVIGEGQLAASLLSRPVSPGTSDVIIVDKAYAASGSWYPGQRLLVGLQPRLGT